MENTDANPAEIRNTLAAAGIYNNDRLQWSTEDSENIRVNNAMGWTRTAHCIRAGSNLGPGKPWIDKKGISLKSYYFNNFHSIAGRKAGGLIRFQNGNCPSRPSFNDIVIKDCSFWTSASKWLLLTNDVNNRFLIKNVILKNLFFVNPIVNPTPEVSGVENLTIENLYIGGAKVLSPQVAGFPDNFKGAINFFNDFNL